MRNLTGFILVMMIAGCADPMVTRVAPSEQAVGTRGIGDETAKIIGAIPSSTAEVLALREAEERSWTAYYAASKGLRLDFDDQGRLVSLQLPTNLPTPKFATVRPNREVVADSVKALAGTAAKIGLAGFGYAAISTLTKQIGDDVSTTISGSNNTSSSTSSTVDDNSSRDNRVTDNRQDNRVTDNSIVETTTQTQTDTRTDNSDNSVVTNTTTTNNTTNNTTETTSTETTTETNTTYTATCESGNDCTADVN